MKKLIAFLLLTVFLFSVAYAENVTLWYYELTIRNYTLSGNYTGEINNGVPDGYGIYETQTPDGTFCHYKGNWKSGIMDGDGAMYWDDGSLEIGQYDNGVFISGKYNYNGLKLLTANTDGEETLNPYWLTKRGSVSADEPDSDTVQYIGNRSSRVFHRLDCDSVRTMKEKNKVEFYTREEAIEKNYKPCSRCLP